MTGAVLASMLQAIDARACDVEKQFVGRSEPVQVT